MLLLLFVLMVVLLVLAVPVGIVLLCISLFPAMMGSYISDIRPSCAGEQCAGSVHCQYSIYV